MSYSKNNHPVWEVYDLQRVVKLNVKYWTTKYIALRRWDFAVEYSLLTTAPTSAVAGLFLLETPIGAIVWKYALIATTFLTIAKPLLQLSEKIKKIHEIVLGYKNLEFDLDEISSQVRRLSSYNASMVKEFQQIQKKIQSISQKEPIEKIDGNLREKLYEEVLKELPVESFFIPDK